MDTQKKKSKVIHFIKNNIWIIGIWGLVLIVAIVGMMNWMHFEILKILAYLFLIFVGVIDGVLATGLICKNKIMSESLNQKALYRSKDKTVIEKLFDTIQDVCLCYIIFITISIGIIVIWQKKECEFINGFFTIYEKVIITSAFSVVISMVVEMIKKGHSLEIWRVLFLFLAVVSVALTFYSDMDSDEIKKRIVPIVLWISAFLSLVIETIGKAIVEYNTSPMILRKNIRKDLFYRTPGINVNIPHNEMERFCERVFNNYIQAYDRTKKIEKIEFIYLPNNDYGKICYKRVRNITRCFVGISVLLFFIMFIKKPSLGGALCIVLIFLPYLIMTYRFNQNHLKCLKKIAIRIFYDEWGYYLAGKKKEKFVGRVQLLAVSIYHKYIYSFLNIVALCRAVAYNDQFDYDGDKRITYISRVLSQLFVEYVRPLKEKNWILYLPLWAAALFEYNVTGKVNNETKKVLSTSYNEENENQINIFLQSFWFDDMGMDAKQRSVYVKDFVREEICN